VPVRGEHQALGRCQKQKKNGKGKRLQGTASDLARVSCRGRGRRERKEGESWILLAKKTTGGET